MGFQGLKQNRRKQTSVKKLLESYPTKEQDQTLLTKLSHYEVRMSLEIMNTISSIQKQRKKKLH